MSPKSTKSTKSNPQRGVLDLYQMVYLKYQQSVYSIQITKIHLKYVRNYHTSMVLKLKLNMFKQKHLLNH